MVRSLRVLIAEDESIIRIGLCRILEDAGYQVVTAPDGRTAVKLARQTGPDLVILDIKMPNLDGLEAARRIYDHRPVPIVILTAYGDQELVQEAADLPIMAYLIKPVNERELLATAEIVTARFDEQQQVIQRAAQLENKLAARKLIEQAKGLLMKRDSLSEEEAYRRIQHQARQERRPMHKVAQEILRHYSARSPGSDCSN
jgi:AmiR/NasT family two-component response regulator